MRQPTAGGLFGQIYRPKFGFRCTSYADFCNTIEKEVDGNAAWLPGLTLGMVLAELRKDRSTKAGQPGDSQREITDRLLQPKKNKHKPKKGK